MTDEITAKEGVAVEAQTEPTPVETTGSLPSTTPSEPLESSTTTDTPSMANNDNQGLISENNPIIPTESEKPLENQAPISEPNETKQELEKIPENPENTIKEVKTPVSTPESPTDQIPVSEPLAEPENIEIKPVETTPEELPPSASLPEEKPLASSNSETPELEPIKTESSTESNNIQADKKPAKQILEIKSEPVSESKPEPKPITEIIPAVIVISKSKSIARELLVKARNMIQFRKRKKLDKIMTLFAKQTKITNDEVEKFMHVSDATATRYLKTLEKENKIKQSGKTGKSVFYSKI